MSVEEQERSHGMDDDRQHPTYYMPEKLKDVAAAERDLRVTLIREPFNYGQQMHKVPPVLRLENNSNDYEPMVVALGPYHHGKIWLESAENFKVKALQHIIVDTCKSVQFFFDEVLQRVGNVRRFYTEGSTNKFDDSTFAQMMLLDSCFIISYILAPKKPRFASTILSDLGHWAFAIINRDLFLLENQIPLWFLKLVMYLGYDSEAENLVDVFIYQNFDFSRTNGIELAIYNPDIHFLDACRRVLLSECDEPETPVHSCCKFRFGWHKWTNVFRRLHLRHKWTRRIKEKCHGDYTYVPWFHSALDLKRKGIHLRTSRDYSLMALRFKSGYHYAQLQLPILHISTDAKAFFSNLIAYEFYLDSSERKVTGYIKFMKLIIVHAGDVKELREKGILLISSGSDEEVVEMFKELNTSTLSIESPFDDVRVQIQKHFRSKFKSWLVEFLYTYFGGHGRDLVQLLLLSFFF